MSYTDDDLSKARNEGYAEAMGVIAKRIDGFRQTATALLEMGNGLLELADTAQRWIKFQESQKKGGDNGGAQGSAASH